MARISLGSNQCGRVNFIQRHVHQGPPLFPILRHGRAQPQPSSHCYPRPPSHYLSNLTTDSPVLVLHLFRHQQPSSHTVHVHSVHVTKPSQHSVIHSTRQLSFYSSSSTDLFVPNCPFVSLLPKFLNTSSPEHSLIFSLHFSYPMYLPPYNALPQLLRHSNTCSHLYPILLFSTLFSGSKPTSI